jgi:hypothetical protein
MEIERLPTISYRSGDGWIELTELTELPGY